MRVLLVLVFLGFVQGLTEFLPVSSSGHLVLFSKMFGIEESLFVSILLHVATLFSIVCVFRREIWYMFTHPLSQETINLVFATIPTCFIALILMKPLKMSFLGGVLPICFALTAVELLFCEKLQKKKVCNGPISPKIAFLMGVAQGFAVFPGISRSGTTISAGLVAGGEKEKTAKFSFLMSLPIILLSLVLEVYEIFTTHTFEKIEFWPMFCAFITAFVTGIVAIKFMLKVVSKSNMKGFAIYLFLVSIFSFIVL